MNRGINYEKEKRRATVGIVASAIFLALVVSIGLAGWFFFLDAWAEAIKAQRNEQWFDPQEDSAGWQDSYKCWEMTGISEEFAVDFKETYHYYFAFDSSWNPVIVKMKGDFEEAYQPYRDAVYDEGAKPPEPFMLRGVAAPVEDDIREFAVESLNILFDSEVISEDTFEELMGVSILDTTQKPMGKGSFSMAMEFGIVGVVFSVLWSICLTNNIKKRKKIGLAQEKERESMRQAAVWQNPVYEDQGFRDDSGYRGGAGGWENQGRNTGAGNGGSGRDASGYPQSGSGVRLVPVRKSNMFLGILGAIGGSLLGVGLWLLISFTGFIAGFAGFVMLKCALKGYDNLSGRLDKKGAVASLVIAAFMVFFANVLEYVIALCRAFLEWDASFDTIRYVVMNFGRLMSETDSWGGFYMNLVLGYGLSIWASYKAIWGILSYKEP